MQALIHDVHPKNVYTSHPGPVGTIGNPVPKPRFRQSRAAMPWAYDPYYAGERGNRLGANITDGQWKSYNTGGGPARSGVKKWTGNRDTMRHQYGYLYHNIAPNAKLYIPVLGPQGDVAWRDKMARTQLVKPVGRLFLPKNAPGYGLQGTLRSGNYPVATTQGGDQGPVRMGVQTADLEPVQRAAPVPGANTDLSARANMQATGRNSLVGIEQFHQRVRIR